MENIGQVLQQRQPAESRSVSTEISNRCGSSLRPATREDFAKTLACLVALKRTADLSRPQIEAWYAVLGCFPIQLINRAVLEVCLNETRFPELGDLYQICRRQTPKPYVAYGDGEDSSRPTKSEINSIAQRLGLLV